MNLALISVLSSPPARNQTARPIAGIVTRQAARARRRISPGRQIGVDAGTAAKLEHLGTHDVPSLAMRKPLKIRLRCGRSQLRNVTPATCSAVAQLPPRRTR